MGRHDSLTRSRVDSGLARQLCRAVARSLLASRGRAPRREDLASLRRWAPVALAGAAGVQLPLRVRARLSLLACMAPWGDGGSRRLARFRRAWEQVSTCGAIQHLARQSLPPPAPPGTPLHFAPDTRGTDFVGFHPRESDDRGIFRWTEPAALWRLALPRADYRACLRLSLPPSDPELRLYLNGRAIHGEPGGPAADTLAFAVPRDLLREGGEQHLVLLSAPFRPSERGSMDGRTLGVAVRSLALAPVAPSDRRGLHS